MKNDTMVTFVGHSTILVEMGGVRLLTDPVIGSFIGPIRRQTPAPDPSTLKVDAILISHLHGDHFSLSSLKKLGCETQLIVPAGAALYLKARGFRNVHGIKENETFGVNGLQVSATKAVHGGRQLPWTPVIEPLGFLLEGKHKIYFAGDTDIFPEMSTIGRSLDLALIPVWGWGPTLGKGHMDPLNAAESLVHLRPRLAIPIHWGTYGPIGIDRLYTRFLRRPPLDFAQHAANITPDVCVQILQPGESTTLP
jgi:L-ascorbate metabolism protein UlaG (beta-lactamase superfamily)